MGKGYDDDRDCPAATGDAPDQVPIRQRDPGRPGTGCELPFANFFANFFAKRSSPNQF